MVAASRFEVIPPRYGGRGDWIQAAMSLISPVMSRRERELPRHMVVAVTDTRIYLMGASKWGVGEEFRSWDRAHVKATAERSNRNWEVWVQPPGSTPGFELRSSPTAATDAVVDALTRH